VAGLLGIPAGGPVVDRTGLKGFYDLSLHFAPVDAKDSDLPDFFTAVEEQLGLKLKPAKVPAKFLVVDSVDPKPALD
ncbi:MAG TPA: TIGR03435 family protein, partial [Edaphobacter sp.]|uniref:TIGR03435 family protein n=1 Tax=Edaphobacter sp. TaxID=1934404 RepID=UPI002B748C2D